MSKTPVPTAAGWLDRPGRGRDHDDTEDCQSCVTDGYRAERDALKAEVAALRAALLQVIGAHQPETVEMGATCDRGFDEPGSGCCGACDRTVTTTVCTCGAGLDLVPCPTLVVAADALGVVLGEDAPGSALPALLAARLDALPPADGAR